MSDEAGGEYLDYGTLGIQVEASQYNVTSLRDAMINSAALAIQQSATGSNCYDMKYVRDDLNKRSQTSWMGSIFGLESRDHASISDHTMNVCNAMGFVGINYFTPYWRLAAEPGATDFLDVRYNFNPIGGDFLCDFIQDLIDGLAVVAPEFAVEDIELGEAIDAVCTSALSH